MELIVWHGQACAAEWQTYLSEGFSGAETMFYTGQAGEAFYAVDGEGRYVIDGLQTDSDSLSALTDSLYYYYAETNCELLESTAGELAFCGIVFHYNKTVPGKLSYYVFYTYGDGYYGAKRVIGNQVEIILPLTKSDMVNKSGANKLGVDAQGTRFDLYINGKYVDGFTDVRIDGGGFGFNNSKRSKAAFADFAIKVELRGGGIEPVEPANTGENAEPAGTRDDFQRYKIPEIPRDPNAAEFQLGNTLGPAHRHWRRAKFLGRFRLFFRFSSMHKAIVYAWVNDETTLRKAGARSDPYAAFSRQLREGNPPDGWEDLLHLNYAHHHRSERPLRSADPARG